MRLKKIILSGFKSFVDQTTLTFPANVVGIVGPNGCGKSNVIDAIRWVMGEASAKTLRGESMTDVIFNGSAVRKPVGRATVELVFDNQRGRAPGIYAQYAEISVKRSLSRDGQSDYLLNHNKVRRRDITDLFLGTGLGPRSYSIIEQGMVSRIVEARPEDLRTLVEEAAGISRYKERRRETENRIRHTRENLQRVEDIRQELESHLRKLKRQAKAAQRFKTFKTQQQQLRGQLLTLQWQSQQQQIGLQEQQLGQFETALQEAIAGQRKIEAGIENVRSRELEAQKLYNQEQKAFYAAGAEISQQQQQLQYLQQTRQQQQQELQDNTGRQQQLLQQQAIEKQKLEDLCAQLQPIRPALDELSQQVMQATRLRNENETAQQTWQEQWQSFSREATLPAQQIERHKGRIQALQQQVRRSVERQQRLQNERGQLLARISDTDVSAQQLALEEKTSACKQQETALDKTESVILQLRQNLRLQQEQRDTIRSEWQRLKGRLQTLQELQTIARSDKDLNLQQWLTDRGLANPQRLADTIAVCDGWERAADQVLGEKLHAVLVDNLDHLATADLAGSEANITFIEAGPQQSAKHDDSLLAVVSSEQTALSTFIGDVRRIESLSQALQQRKQLQPGESFITSQGIWIGVNWLRFPATAQGAGEGILSREAEIQQLSQQLDTLGNQLATQEQLLKEQRTILDQQETQRVEQRQQLRKATEVRNRLQQTCSHQQAQVLQHNQRLQQIDLELAEITEQIGKDQTELAQTETDLQHSEASAQGLQQQQQTLLQQRDVLQSRVNHSRQQLDELINRQHRTTLQQQQIQAQIDTTSASVQRLQQQQQRLAERQQQLQEKSDQLEQPVVQLGSQIEKMLQQQLTIEQSLQHSRQQTSSITDQLHQLGLERSRHLETIEKRRQRLDEHRLTLKERVVRCETLVEQLRTLQQDLAEVLENLPADFDESSCQQQLDALTKKMDRLGQVNLVAINEFEEESKRKANYDSQSEDLNKALDMLTSVMHKIDQDTRQRFKETFEALNLQYQRYFPQLFGAGKAHLELSDEDLLSAGVRVMARPPGKRNSTIHLLSGGEKALAAVALIFAFFELNPAPFCVLDEVDAPLDDANVERFCQALGKIAERTQLLFISHNKIAMESADILIGVTMSEAGVSRLVSVDIEQAMKMAALA